MAARTLAAISESKKAKGLYVSPSLADNVKHIFDFFPFSPEVLKIIFWCNILLMNNTGGGKYSRHQLRGTSSPCKVQIQSSRIFLLEKPVTTRCYFDLHARKVLNLVTMVVELADFTDITQVLLLL